MPRTIEVTVFTARELLEDPATPPTIKERVRRYLRQNDSDTSEALGQLFADRLADWGYPTATIEFRYGLGQGDGMAFYTGGRSSAHGARWVDLRRLWLRRGLYLQFPREVRRDIYKAVTEYLGDAQRLDIGIERNSFGHQYSHYNTMRVTVGYPDLDDHAEATDGPRIKDWIEQLEAAIQADVRDASKELDALARAEFEYQDSDACLLQTADSCGVEFTADGRDV